MEQKNKKQGSTDKDKNENLVRPASSNPEGKPVEIISLDMGEEGEEPLELSAETTLSLLEEAQEEEYDEEIARHTDDKDIQESLEARQDLNVNEKTLQQQLKQYHALSPELSGGDVDAAWNKANVGEETVGGMAPTPDQDMVDELGEAAGLTYEEGEPLRTGEKLDKRDEERWELNPESAEETAS